VTLVTAVAVQALALVQLLVPLVTCLQALLSVKDLRSPLLLRVMLRPAVVLIAPLLSGSFLAGAGLIGRPVTAAGQVFAIVVGCIVSHTAHGPDAFAVWVGLSLQLRYVLEASCSGFVGVA
jgi:hypothetical protein